MNGQIQAALRDIVKVVFTYHSIMTSESNGS